MMRTRLITALPVVGLLLIGGLAWNRLDNARDTETEPGAPPDVFTTGADNRGVPSGVLPVLRGSGAETAGLTVEGERTLVNLFASWCAPCEVEHPYLLEIAAAEHARLVGVVYKDDPDKGLGFIDRLGDPFDQILLDADGLAAIDLGFSGVPGTFLVDESGRIVRQFRGALTRADVVEIVAFFDGGDAGAAGR